MPEPMDIEGLAVEGFEVGYHDDIFTLHSESASEMAEALARGMSSEDYFLQRAYRRGRGGSIVPLTAASAGGGIGVPQDPLVSLDVPPWCSRTWLVTILAMQDTGVFPNGGAYPAGVPPRNAVRAYDYGNGTNCPLVARVDFGTSFAAEQAFLDVPFSGITFEVNAALLRVGLVPVPGAFFSGGLHANLTLPRIGAFATARTGGRGKSSTMYPTFTTPRQLLNPSTVGQFEIPPRAVGYKLITSDGFGATGLPVANVGVNQIDGNGFVLQTDAASVNLQQFTQGYQGNGLVYLHPGATQVQVTNTDATNAHTVQAIFLLDLC